jgi:hypothetical protein
MKFERILILNKINLFTRYLLFIEFICFLKALNYFYNFFMGIGDWGWGLGIGDWGLGPIPNPQSPIPNPQSPIPNEKIKYVQ